jgi:hypothetical protein
MMTMILEKIMIIGINAADNNIFRLQKRNVRCSLLLRFLRLTNVVLVVVDDCVCVELTLLLPSLLLLLLLLSSFPKGTQEDSTIPLDLNVLRVNVMS